MNKGNFHNVTHMYMYTNHCTCVWMLIKLLVKIKNVIESLAYSQILSQIFVYK